MKVVLKWLGLGLQVSEKGAIFNAIIITTSFINAIIIIVAVDIVIIIIITIIITLKLGGLFANPPKGCNFQRLPLCRFSHTFIASSMLSYNLKHWTGQVPT